MNTLKKLALLLGLLISLVGCGSPASPAAAPAAATTPSAATGGLTEDYNDALSVRNQLAYGTLKLEGSAETITAEQAAKLLPLWQALKTLSASSTSATEEVTAVQSQISAAMAPAQVSVIAGLKLTNAMLQAYYVEIGVSVASTPEPGVTPQSGSFRICLRSSGKPPRRPRRRKARQWAAAAPAPRRMLCSTTSSSCSRTGQPGNERRCARTLREPRRLLG